MGQCEDAWWRFYTDHACNRRDDDSVSLRHADMGLIGGRMIILLSVEGATPGSICIDSVVEASLE